MAKDPQPIDFWSRWIAGGLRIFFKLLYNEFAWAYDSVAWMVSLGRWIEWTQSVLPYLTLPGSVLEIGHGTGHVLLGATELGIRAVGIDSSYRMNRIGYQRLQKSGYEPEIINGYAQRLPIRAEAFAAVVATFPAEFILAPNSAAEIWRVLIPRGSLLIIPSATIDGNSLPDRVLAALFRLTRQAPAALHEDTFRAYSQPLVEAGFLVETRSLKCRSSTVYLIKADKPG